MNRSSAKTKSARAKNTSIKRAESKVPATYFDTSTMSPELAAFVRKHWPAKGRAGRIARAKKAGEEARRIGATFKKMDLETLRWIAEDPDLEYM